MKRQKRKARKKLSMLWDEAMDFEVAIRPLAEARAELPENVILLPLRNLSSRKSPPPPLAA